MTITITYYYDDEYDYDEYDDEAPHWGFPVPAPHIVDGGVTRGEARQRA